MPGISKYLADRTLDILTDEERTEALSIVEACGDHWPIQILMSQIDAEPLMEAFRRMRRNQLTAGQTLAASRRPYHPSDLPAHKGIIYCPSHGIGINAKTGVVVISGQQSRKRGMIQWPA